MEGEATTQRPRPTIALIYAITATGIMANPLVAPVIPDILADLDAPRASAGWVIGAVTLPGIALAPVIGLLADRYGRRTVLVPCLLLFALGGTLAATADSIEGVALWRLVQGAGSAGLVNLAVVLIGDYWSGTQRAAMIGRNSAVLTVCLTLFPLIGGALSDLVSWRMAFAPFALAPLTALAVWRRLPSEDHRDDAGMLAQFARALPKLRTPQVVILLTGGLLVFSLVFGVLMTIMPVYLESAFGLSATLRGLVLGAPAVATTAVALVIGPLRARLSYRTLLMAGSAVMAAALLAISAAATVTALIVAVLAFGLSEGLVIPTLQERAASSGGPEARATVMAVFVSASRLGQTVGPVGAAWLAAGAGGAPVAFAAGAGVAAAMALLFLALPRADRSGRR